MVSVLKLMTYDYVYNLETGSEASKEGILEAGIFYGIRYYSSDENLMVEIGDGYRHEIFLEAKYWNKIMEFIKRNKEDNLTEAIVKGLMSRAISDDLYKNLVNAIKEGKIRNA